MEASLTRSFTNRHFLNSLLLLPKHHHHSQTLFFPIISQHTKLTTISFSKNPNSHPPKFNFPKFNLPKTTTTPFQSNTPISTTRFARILSGHSEKSFEWKLAFEGENDAKSGLFGDDKRPVATVVVLGWLGSKQKHLRRYAEMYNKVFGMDAVTFAASISDVLGFDLGRKIETRISALTDELVAWLEEKEKDGRERFLVFHTFSNTGWLA